MNYLDVYFSRVNYFGDNTTDRINNSGIVAFEKWLAQSPFTVRHLSVERGLYFSGIIETSKDREEKKIMYLYVANDIPIRVGDILTWKQDDGTVEKWLLLQKIHKVHPTYQTYQIIKCNYQIKWIDFDGKLRKQWAYAVSSVDSKIKSNFRMWHSLVSPQPNKFAEVIMPRPIFESGTEDLDRLMRGITFIIENEGWTVIECDWTSVEGIAYMSLTESKVNYLYDDRIVDVAELDRFKFPALQSSYMVGETISPTFSEDTYQVWDIVMTVIDGAEHIAWEDDELKADSAGQIKVKMQLKNTTEKEPNKAVEKIFEITIYNTSDNFKGYIFGADEIRLARESCYYVAGETGAILDSGDISMIIKDAPADNNPPALRPREDDSSPDQRKPQPDPKWPTLRQDELVWVPDKEDPTKEIPKAYKYILETTAQTNLGDIVLEATYNDGKGKIETYTKTVKVVPLWQVN